MVDNDFKINEESINFLLKHFNVLISLLTNKTTDFSW